MYAPGTRVKLLSAVDGYGAGTEAVIVFDLGDDVCQIALLQGGTLEVACSVLALVVEGAGRLAEHSDAAPQPGPA